MADIITEIKKNGHYSTNTVAEGMQADSLQKDGVVSISLGDTIVKNGKLVTIRHCKPTDKFRVLTRKGII